MVTLYYPYHRVLKNCLCACKFMCKIGSSSKLCSLKTGKPLYLVYILLFLFVISSFFVLFSSLLLTRLENIWDVASVLQFLIYGFSKHELTFLRSGTGLDHDTDYDSVFPLPSEQFPVWQTFKNLPHQALM